MITRVVFEIITLFLSASICSAILLLTILQIHNDPKGRAFSVLMLNVVIVSFTSMLIRVIGSLDSSPAAQNLLSIMITFTITFYHAIGFSLTNFIAEVFNDSSRRSKWIRIWLLVVHVPTVFVLLLLGEVHTPFIFNLDGSITYGRTTIGTLLFLANAILGLSISIPLLVKGFRRSEYPRSLLIGVVLFIIAPTILILPPSFALRINLQEVTQTVAALLVIGPLLQQRLFDPLTQLNKKLFNRSNQLSTIARVGHRATSLLNLSRLLEFSVSDIKSASGYSVVTINLVAPNDGYLVVSATTNRSYTLLENSNYQIPIDATTLVGTAALKREIVCIQDTTDKRYKTDAYQNCGSVIAIPLVVGESNVSEEVLLGVLEIQSAVPSAFEDDEIEILQILSRQLAIAIRNAQLFDAKETAEAADRAKSQFLANMSHELRLPLTIIQANSMMLLNGVGVAPVEGTQIKAMRYIEDAGNNLLSLVETLLHLTKIEAGRVETNFTQVNIRELIYKVISNMEVLAKDKSLYLEIEASNFPETIYTDSNKVHTIVTNLVSNAIKFTSSGGIKIKLEIVGNCWDLVVSDTGIGIADEHHNKIFDNFYQVETSDKRTHSGSGIGLAIVKKLVTLMDGNVNLQSKLGIGSTFRVTLPLHDQQ